MINDAGKHEVKNGNFVMAERGGDSHQGQAELMPFGAGAVRRG
jgi:hypothetical protein